MLPSEVREDEWVHVSSPTPQLFSLHSSVASTDYRGEVHEDQLLFRTDGTFEKVPISSEFPCPTGATSHLGQLSGTMPQADIGLIGYTRTTTDCENNQIKINLAHEPLSDDVNCPSSDSSDSSSHPSPSEIEVDFQNTPNPEQKLAIDVDIDSHVSTSNDSCTLDIHTQSKSDDITFETEITTDDPRLETETKIEVLPDGTVVTRKITKTIRKRMVAKNLITKNEDGDITLSTKESNSSMVKKFLSLGSSDQSVSPPAVSADQSPDESSAATHFLAMSPGDIDDLGHSHTKDLPADIEVERTITVLQSQTTCIEGEENLAASSVPGMAMDAHSSSASQQ